MTAQVAVMNKEAIALASDSAITMYGQKGQKIFTSANKLFALSKYYPVGLMVYGSAIFMGVPWETIVKIYRSKLGKQKFKTLKEYANDFIGFLDNGNPLFPDSEQRNYVYGRTSGYFNIVKKDIEEKAASIIQKKRITKKETKQITSETIKEHYDRWMNIQILPSISKLHIKNITDKYGDLIIKAKEEVFEKLPISVRSLNQLKKISASLFSRDKFPGGISGVVIAGFGEKDTFPSLWSLQIDGIAGDRLKYKEDEPQEISLGLIATIISFAQKEMVSTFMEGIDPYYKDFTENYLAQIFDKYPEMIIESIKKLDAQERREFKRKLKNASRQVFKDYLKLMEDYRKEHHISPITGVVAMLPKDELAAMAEALVSLTSFKRKVTLESETVGGPVDVAVISKGDGFIWIKRKHYFNAELNPQFFANYYREEGRWKEAKRKNRHAAQ